MREPGWYWIRIAWDKECAFHKGDGHWITAGEMTDWVDEDISWFGPKIEEPKETP